MTRPFYHFRGIPEFIEAAASRSGRPDLAGTARRIEALTTLASLCSQAVDAQHDSNRVTAILQQAAEFRQQLKIAFDAADAMLTAVSRACENEPCPSLSTVGVNAGKRDRSRRRKSKSANETSEQ